ncbi:universal stress protein [Yinghuangia soli]|uniref:Universal stress protein n=1 Tax=Yinghuangia soli TaxID=2908204 RepID=A0AA41Q9C6_9ACTN|nr:universal stress protein [Yinghuangia soli]MCF2533828.1 universal stress protein [Yinghuangia soli]
MPENDGRDSGEKSLVVGVEDTAAGRLAVAWAADEAARRHLPLRLVHALGGADGMGRESAAPTEQTRVSGPRIAGEHAVDAARAVAHGRQPGLLVQDEISDGSPEQVLRAAASDAAMVVLGSRRRSAARELLTSGSIAAPVAAHVSCPVAVIRHAEHTLLDPPKIVVGVDGSANSEPALAWAFDEAARRGAAVLAVRSCPMPLTPVAAAMTDGAVSRVRAELRHQLLAWQKKYPTVDARSLTRYGHPVPMLVEASGDALCLVVGTYGLGGFERLLLGSVSRKLIHHAPCPLVIVPGEAAAG